MQPIDTRIMNAALDALLADPREFTVSVAQTNVCASRDKKEILASLETMDEDYLAIRREGKEGVFSFIFLVHGNEDGVIIADYGTSLTMIDKIIEKVVRGDFDKEPA